MFTAEQETHIVNMVIANNSIRLREIQQRIIEDDTTFQNIHNVSISVLCCVLARNRIRMKKIYRVPFERNSEHVKQLWYDYVQVSYSIIGTESGSAYCSSVREWTQTEDPSARITIFIDRKMLYNNFTPRVSRGRGCGVGLQRVSENKDNPTQKTGHTTKVQNPKTRNKHTENTTPGTACNELTKTT